MLTSHLGEVMDLMGRSNTHRMVLAAEHDSAEELVDPRANEW
jgi:hypothetical protein